MCVPQVFVCSAEAICELPGQSHPGRDRTGRGSEEYWEEGLPLADHLLSMLFNIGMCSRGDACYNIKAYGSAHPGSQESDGREYCGRRRPLSHKLSRE